MINYSYNPTDENALKLLETDYVDRRQDIGQFLKLLSNMEDDCYSIALNGDWGAGKTFFIKQAKLFLDAYNPCSSMEDDLRSSVQQAAVSYGFSVPDSYTTVYYDAWINDNHTDPILSLVYASITSGQIDLPLEKDRSICEITAALVSILKGYDLPTLLEKLNGTDQFEALKTADDVQSYVRKFIDQLIQERGNRVVFFIDELDRCKPDYAIQFLERIKHYFDDDRVTFVFSVSLSQLQWTVRSYYGSEFDSTRYLDKFFDLRIPLRGLNYSRFFRNRLHLDDAHIFNAVAIVSAEYFHFTIREIERYGRMLKIANSAARSLPVNTPQNRAMSFSSSYIVPIILAVQMYDIAQYNRFMTGKEPDLMTDILLKSDLELYTNFLTIPGETYLEETREIMDAAGQTRESLAKRLERVYRVLFSGHTGDSQNIVIGKMAFSDSTRRGIAEIASMLSPGSDYRG